MSNTCKHGMQAHLGCVSCIIEAIRTAADASMAKRKHSNITTTGFSASGSRVTFPPEWYDLKPHTSMEYVSVEIPREAFELLCLWASTTRTLKESIRILSDHITDDDDENEKIDANITELEALLRPIERVNDACKNKFFQLQGEQADRQKAPKPGSDKPEAPATWCPPIDLR
jgi:hypothetical protein